MQDDAMTLQQLKYIIKIVECGSITEAAKQLFITQPSLSAAVKDLEKELCIEIFYRTAKGISLSDDLASLFNLLIWLSVYTICSGVLSRDLTYWLDCKRKGSSQSIEYISKLRKLICAYIHFAF